MNDNKNSLISRVDVSNFRSIRDASLDLRGLTILVGENSAGKSSFLQAILLIAQMPHVSSSSTTIGLNGPELSFGAFADIHHAGSPDSDISISLHLPQPTIGEAQPIKPRQVEQVDWEQDYSGPDYAPIDVLSLDLGDPGDRYGVADLRRIRILSGLDTPFIDDPREILDVSPLANPDGVNELLRPSIHLGTVSRASSLVQSVLAGEKAPGIFFVGYDGPYFAPAEEISDEIHFSEPLVVVERGFPVEAFQMTVSLAQHYDRWWSTLLDNTTADGAETMRSVGVGALPGDWSELGFVELADRLLPYFSRYLLALEEVGIGRLHLHPDGAAKDRFEIVNLDHLRAQHPWIYNEFQDRLSPGELPPPILIGGGTVGGISTARSIRRRLGGSIHYLGPLRSGPTALQQEGQTGKVATLGTSGEYAISVLSQRRDEVILCPVIGGEIREMPLIDGVNHWAQAFGIAHGVEVKQHGRLGLELEILDVQGGGIRHLSSLGVGVSQLLPVIVLCLLAEPGDLVLVEQPELHLHPAPQQVLADFLIGTMESGRQLVIETHSEYLIDRLRLRVAEDSTDILRERVDVYYASRSDGATSFLPLAMDRFGSFDLWPQGFFDQVSQDSTAILKAAARRARTEVGIWNSDSKS